MTLVYIITARALSYVACCLVITPSLRSVFQAGAAYTLLAVRAVYSECGTRGGRGRVADAQRRRRGKVSAREGRGTDLARSIGARSFRSGKNRCQVHRLVAQRARDERVENSRRVKVSGPSRLVTKPVLPSVTAKKDRGLSEAEQGWPPKVIQPSPHTGSLAE